MILGIDLGTEWCRLATANEQGQIQTISSTQTQDQKTPVAVGFSGQWLWGWSALDAPAPVARDLKGLFSSGELGTFAGRGCDAERLLGEFFRGLRLSLLEMFGRSNENHIVLGVPYSFGIRERQVVRKTLADAGLHLAAILNEAEATLLACGLEDHVARGEAANVLVLDAGAEKTRLSLVEVGWDGDCLRSELIMHDDQTPGFRSVHRALLAAAGCDPDMRPPEALITQALGPLLNHKQDLSLNLGGRDWTIRQEAVASALSTWRLAVDDGLRRVWEAADMSAGQVQIAVATGGGCEIEQARAAIAFFPVVLEPPPGAGYENLVAWGAGCYALMLAGKTPRSFRGAQTPAIGLALADGSFHAILDSELADGGSDFRVYEPSTNHGEPMGVLPMQGLARRAVGNAPLVPVPWSVAQISQHQPVKIEVTREANERLRFAISQGYETQEKTLEVGWIEGPTGAAPNASQTAEGEPQ